MTGAFLICRHCHRVTPIINQSPGPRFAWCEACQALYRSSPPDPPVPAGKPRVKKSTSGSRPTSKKPKATKH